MVEKTLGLKVVAGLTAIGGVLGVLGGLLFFVAGGAIMGMLGASAASGGIFGAIFGMLGIVLLAFGAIGCALAWYLWQGSNVARWIIGVLAGLSVLSILGGNILGAIVGAVEVYFLFFDKDTKAVFE